MALPALSSVAAMETALGLEVGSLAGLDLARAEASLADASAFARTLADRPWVDAEGNVTAPETVVAIVKRAAVRDYRNPDGVSNEALAQGAYSYTYAEGQSTIYFTEDEVALIRKAALDGDGTSPSGWSGTGSVYTPSAYTPDEGETVYPYWWGSDDPRYGWGVGL